MDVYSLNGYLDSFLRKEYGKTCCTISTFKAKKKHLDETVVGMNLFAA
jgi:hypothetical protein